MKFVNGSKKLDKNWVINKPSFVTEVHVRVMCARCAEARRPIFASASVFCGCPFLGLDVSSSSSFSL